MEDGPGGFTLFFGVWLHAEMCIRDRVTGYGTTESTGILEFKVALWELSEDKATTSYVAGTTVYFPTGGECSTPRGRYWRSSSYISAWASRSCTETGRSSSCASCSCRCV